MRNAIEKLFVTSFGTWKFTLDEKASPSFKQKPRGECFSFCVQN